jgi:hypothetical protein
MTGDELQRGMGFILKSQTRAGARIERNEEQLSQLAEQVTQLTQAGAETPKNVSTLRQERTEATVDMLSQKVEALVKVVEEGRDGGR